MVKFSELKVVEAEGPLTTVALPPSHDALPSDWASHLCGTYFTPHMLTIKYDADAGGWQAPEIRPFCELSFHPAALVLHFAVQNMETLKAYRGVDEKVRLFRPLFKMERLRDAALRLCLPSFDPHDLLSCLAALIRKDISWVPPCGEGSLYARPMLLATEPNYNLPRTKQALLYCILSPAPSKRKDFKSGDGALKLWVDTDFSRCWPGGVAAHKMGCVYTPTIKICNEAVDAGCHIPLWLFGLEQEVLEAGGMNLMVVWKTEDGKVELATPDLEKGLILPGIVRKSLLVLAQEMGLFDSIREKTILLDDIRRAVREGRFLEMFGCGTGSMMQPFGEIRFKQTEEVIKLPVTDPQSSYVGRLKKRLSDIQEGRELRPDWVLEI